MLNQEYDSEKYFRDEVRNERMKLRYFQIVRIGDAKELVIFQFVQVASLRFVCDADDHPVEKETRRRCNRCNSPKALRVPIDDDDESEKTCV